MEHIYPHPTDHCKLVSASEETVRFLTDYSKSLAVIETDGISFESNLN